MSSTCSRFVALALFCLAALAPTSAGAATASPRVVGGTMATTPGWMTQVWVKDGNSTGLCGGELVSSRWLLTAAHCVRAELGGFPLAASTVHLRIGVPTLSEPTTADPGTSVDQIRIDPANTSGSTTGDVALLHLAAPVPAIPVALADAGAAPAGAEPAVLGWGTTASGSVSASLQQVAQTIIDSGRCSAYGSDFVAESMICSGGVVGQDSCTGDSGGPLALGAEGASALLLGTVDYGSDRCGDGTPAVYQRLTEGTTAAWLRSVLVRPAIAPSTAIPAAGGKVGLTATSAWTDATYAWDLDGDGAYDDASGAAVTTAASARTVSVLATSAAAGESAVARYAIVPVDPVLTVSAAAASVREGGLITLTAVSRGGTGTLTAATSGVTKTPKTVAVPAGGTASIALRVREDHVWKAPRTLRVALSTTGTLKLTATSLTVKVVDDDTPALTGVKVTGTAAGSSVRAHLPGRGTLTATAVLNGRTIATRTVSASSARTVALKLAVSATQRRRHPQITLRWRSRDAAGITARATRRL